MSVISGLMWATAAVMACRANTVTLALIILRLLRSDTSVITRRHVRITMTGMMAISGGTGIGDLIEMNHHDGNPAIRIINGVEVTSIRRDHGVATIGRAAMAWGRIDRDSARHRVLASTTGVIMMIAGRGEIS